MARDYLAEKGPGVIRVEALRWFVTTGRYRPKVGTGRAPTQMPRTDPAEPPPTAASDLGATPWEKALIRAVRRNVSVQLSRRDVVDGRQAGVKNRSFPIGIRSTLRSRA
jgi:hypothetical protein